MARKLGAPLGVAGWVGLAVLVAGCGEATAGDIDVHDIQPRAGATAGEQPVRITGANFRQDIGYAVYFGAIRATQLTILDDTTLLVATPQHDAGPVDVVVVADNGPAFRLHNAFQFNDQGGNVMEQVGEGAGGGSAGGGERF